MTSTTVLELLTGDYNWEIGKNSSLRRLGATEHINVGDVKGQHSVITTSFVRSGLFIGNLDGIVGKLEVTGNMSGNVVIQGNGDAGEKTMDLEIELQAVAGNVGTFGNTTQIPSINPLPPPALSDKAFRKYCPKSSVPINAPIITINKAKTIV